MYDLYKEFTGKDLKGKSREELLAIAKELEIEVDDSFSSMKLLDEIFGEKQEQGNCRNRNNRYSYNFKFCMCPLG